MKNLMQLKAHKWLLAISLNWFIIVLVIFIAFRISNPILYILASIIVATRQHAVILLMHEGAHYTAMKNRKISDFLTGILTSYPLFFCYKSYRHHHLEHHRHLGTLKDPEIALKAQANKTFDSPYNFRKFVRLLIMDSLGLHIREIFIVAWDWRPRSKANFMIMAVYWAILSIVFYYFHLLSILGFWLLTICTFQWAIFRVRTISEHTGMLGTYRFKTNWLLKWLFFPHNTWAHYEHHKWPGVPYYNLPKLREVKDPEVPVITFTELMEKIAHGKPQEELEKMMKKNT